MLTHNNNNNNRVTWFKTFSWVDLPLHTYLQDGRFQLPPSLRFMVWHYLNGTHTQRHNLFFKRLEIIFKLYSNFPFFTNAIFWAGIKWAVGEFSIYRYTTKISMVMGQRLASADLITYFVLCQHLIQWLNFVFNKASSFQHTTLVLFNFSLHAQVVSGAAALWRNWKRECENSATCLYIKIIFLLLFWSNTSVKCETSFCCKPSSSLFVFINIFLKHICPEELRSRYWSSMDHWTLFLCKFFYGFVSMAIHHKIGHYLQVFVFILGGRSRLRFFEHYMFEALFIFLVYHAVCLSSVVPDLSCRLFLIGASQKMGVRQCSYSCLMR